MTWQEQVRRAGGHPRWVVALVIAVALAFQGSRGLYETSEGRYAECAREMVASGNYLEPTLAGRPHWTKPPLTYWAIAGGIRLLGPSAWGVRLYGALALILTTLAVMRIGRVLGDRTTGALAGLIYGTSPLPFFGASVVTTDMLLTLWETLAVLCALTAWQREAGGRTGAARASAVLMWVCFGAGFMTKGPPALLPLLPLAAWTWKQPRRLGTLFPWPGLVLFVVISGWWYLVVGLRHGGLFDYFLGAEVVGRLTSEDVHNHAWHKFFTIYGPPLLFGAGLWSWFGWRAVVRHRLYRLATLRRFVDGGHPAGFLFVWAALPLVVFLVSASKLQLYILPFFAPLALGVAWAIRRTLPDGRLPRRVWAVALASALLFAGVKAGVAWTSHKHDMQALAAFCRRRAPADARFIALDAPKLYGLQYYLDGNLRRATWEHIRPWEDMRRHAVLHYLRCPRPHTVVLVHRPELSPDLRAWLGEYGLEHRLETGRFWSLCVVPPPPAPPGETP